MVGVCVWSPEDDFKLVPLGGLVPLGEGLGAASKNIQEFATSLRMAVRSQPEGPYEECDLTLGVTVG